MRDRLGIDLTNRADYLRLANDTTLYVRVLWLLCSAQADRRGVTPEQFGRSLAGNAIDRATAALIAASVPFIEQTGRPERN